MENEEKKIPTTSKEYGDSLSKFVEEKEMTPIPVMQIISPKHKIYKAKADFLDKTIKELEERSAWIKTDMSYKAPEQLKGMALNRWVPMMGDMIDNIVIEAKKLK